MIKIENLSLSIPIFTSDNTVLKRKIIHNIAGGKLNLSTNKVARVEALSEINCTIKDGERVALLGHNGSGKTSFLKIISGIYTPTKGCIKKDIKVFPMIQKSFLTSPELSGYTAAKAFYLNVQKTEKGFREFFEKVKNFSEIGNFIYFPIKTYSEGMHSRLLYAILTSFRHECLALDEGFSAGDSSFTAKAEKRMKEFIDNAGTLIFASHNNNLLKAFCSRGLIFDKGKIIFDGKINDAIDFYEEEII